MAHTDTCKIEVCQEIERRKSSNGVRPAIRELSKEMGIPFKTLENWYYPGKNSSPKTGGDKILQPTIYETCAETDLQALIDSGKKFKTILADPPWKYSNQATRSSTNNHYKTLTVDEICSLPISKLSEDNAHLHLWTTNAFLFDSKAVIESWGFEYKSCLVWVKPQLGIGNYWRLSHEFLLLGVRGAMTFRDHSIKSWVEAERTKHSLKPDEYIGYCLRLKSYVEEINYPRSEGLQGQKYLHRFIQDCIWKKNLSVRELCQKYKIPDHE